MTDSKFQMGASDIPNLELVIWNPFLVAATGRVKQFLVSTRTGD
jgi:hypothetical protein